MLEVFHLWPCALQTTLEYIFKPEHTCSFVRVVAHLLALNKIVGSVNNTPFVFGEKDTTLSMVLLLRFLLNFQSLENLNSGTADSIHSKGTKMDRNLDVPFEDDEDEFETIEGDDEGMRCNMFAVTHL